MKRKIQLDGVRGVAVLSIFLYHGLQIPLLWAGVDLFFVLSGYLITGILLRVKDQGQSIGSALGNFYGRRACRILPAFLLFLAVTTVILHVHWLHMWYWYAFFDANFANAFGKVSVWAFVPLWSLAVEEQFYFVWPLVVLLLPIQTLKRVALGIIVLVPILRAVCTHMVPPDCIYCLTPFRMDSLAWGATIAIFEHDKPLWINSHRRLAGGCALAAALLFCSLSTWRAFRLHADTVIFNSMGYSLIGLAFAGMIMYALSTPQGLTYSALTMPPLRYMGQISYTFYLYHFGVLALLRQHVHSRVLVFALALTITGAIAGISWPLFESPILQMRPGGKLGESPRDTPPLLPAQ